MLTQGIAVFAASLHEDPERERSIVREFLRQRVDGLILSTVSKNQSYLFSEIERGTPIVFVDRAPNGIEVDTVSPRPTRRERQQPRAISLRRVTAALPT